MSIIDVMVMVVVDRYLEAQLRVVFPYLVDLVIYVEGYVSSIGYIPRIGFVLSPVSLIELEYRNTLGDYFKSKQVKQENNRTNLTKYINQTWMDRNYQTQIDNWIKSGKLTTGGSSGDPDKDLAEFSTTFIKKSVERSIVDVLRLRQVTL